MMIRIIKGLLCCILMVSMQSCSKPEQEVSFSHDLHLSRIEGNSSHAMVCCHGMGGSYEIINQVNQYAKIDATLIGFNFPDHSIRIGLFDPRKTRFGTIEEIAPVLYVLKEVVIKEKFEKVSLYGFSAGGGAVINTIAVLNSQVYTPYLKQLGISNKDRKKILTAIQKGNVILDAPLKSIGELIDFHEKIEGLLIVGNRYRENGMEPIENISKLKGLSLQFIVNFQSPDEVLSNRDDILYLERLAEIGAKTSVLSIVEGSGHSLPHPHLWEFYQQVQHE